MQVNYGLSGGTATYYAGALRCIAQAAELWWGTMRNRSIMHDVCAQKSIILNSLASYHYCNKLLQTRRPVQVQSYFPTSPTD